MSTHAPPPSSWSVGRSLPLALLPDHVSECGEDEDDSRNELEEEREVVLEVYVVECAEADAERHLGDAECDGEFHLHRVEEGELVRRVVPRRVDSVRIAGEVVDAGRPVGAARPGSGRRASGSRSNRCRSCRRRGRTRPSAPAGIGRRRPSTESRPSCRDAAAR